MSKPVPNRICRDVGHDWGKKTVVQNYRRCVREHCKATQRLVDGHWVDATTTQQRTCTQRPPTDEMLFAVDPYYPGEAEMRRVERAYHNLLGH